MTIKEQLLKRFPFLKARTAKYIIAFSIFRRIVVVIFLVIYN